MPHSPYRDRVIPPSVPRLRVIATAALLAMLLSLTACTSTADPAPTPTATPFFASKKEAFAAAEETYRAYTDASNATVLTDSKTFEPVFAWLRADALDAARKNYSGYNANRLTRIGTSTFDHFTGAAYKAASRTVVAYVCIDVSTIDVVDPEGRSVVPADRPPRRAVEVTMISADTTTGLAISSSIPTDKLTC